MQFTDYKIADITDKTLIAERLAKVENDISKETGNEIVLIAYQKQQNTNK